MSQGATNKNLYYICMSEIVEIPLADLLIDMRNARLKDEQPNQQAALLAVAKQQGKRLLKLATDIVEQGLDPITLTAVVPTDDNKKRYVVIEGNRRIAALKALETPSLTTSAFDTGMQKQLVKLSKRFSEDPIESITCILFETEKEADHWIRLRHTGQNEGVGLVEWGADEKDRYTARHGYRSSEGQVIDFVEKFGELSEMATQSNKGIISSVKRLLSNPTVRERLGIDISDGKVLSWYPAQEVAKGLNRIIEDLKTEKIKVGDIYHAQDRIKYAESIPASHLPNPATQLNYPQPLETLDSSTTSGDLTANQGRPKPKTKKKPRQQSARTAVIPKDCYLNISPPRLNTIYNELRNLSVDQYSNACSVTLRVFVELSIDHYIAQKKLMTGQQGRNDPLAKRLKTVASDLLKQGKIDAQLETAIKKVADSQFVLAASTVTFNQYVHNQYVYPKSTELIVAWDELQPFMEKLWP